MFNTMFAFINWSFLEGKNLYFFYCRDIFILKESILMVGRNAINMLVAQGSACGAKIIVVGNRHGDTSSNPGRDWLHFK